MRKIAVLAGLALAGSGFALDFSGPGFAIVDATTTENGVASSTITISGTGLTVTSLNSVTLTGLSHTFAGDLEIDLEHVATGTSVVLTSPPTTASANFNGTYTFVVNPGLSTIDEVTNGQPSSFNIPSGSYAPSAFGGNRTNYNAFNGLALDSVWRLTITDFAPGDVGSLQSWGFNVSAVPEPGTVAALGLGVAALLRRKKRA